MPNILQVLPGLALVNYLMLDVIAAPAKVAAVSVQLPKTLVIAGSTLAAFLPTLLFSALLEQVLMAQFASSVLSTFVFCVILAAVLQCIGLILVRRNIVLASTLPVLLPLIFGNCVVMGLTMPPDNIGLGTVLTEGLARSAGFALVLVVFTLFRERLAGADIPGIFRGTPTTVIAAALLSMVFMGFAGLA